MHNDPSFDCHNDLSHTTRHGVIWMKDKKAIQWLERLVSYGNATCFPVPGIKQRHISNKFYLFLFWLAVPPILDRIFSITLGMPQQLSSSVHEQFFSVTTWPHHSYIICFDLPQSWPRSLLLSCWKVKRHFTTPLRCVPLKQSLSWGFFFEWNFGMVLLWGVGWEKQDWPEGEEKTKQGCVSAGD